MTGRVLLLCAILSAGLCGPAESRERHGRGDRDDRPAQTDRQGERSDRGSDAAAREAQDRNGGGRVLSVERDGTGHRVKVLKNGEVRIHHIERD